jgi:hypothetical protein
VDRDFAELTWHDNTVYGFRLDPGDPDRGDWTSDLVLDIDHIVEWICGTDGKVLFRVAPATLTFHDATDLRVSFDFDQGHQIALRPLSIASVARDPIRDQKVCLDRPYYRWRIGLNDPKGGEIAFGASGFTQTLRAEPKVSEEQRLSRHERA